MEPEVGSTVDGSEADWDENYEYSCIQSSGEIGHAWDFTIVCNSKHFIVTVSPSAPPDDDPTPVTSLLTQYSKAFAEDDDEKIQDAQDEILDLVLDAGGQKFRALVPPPPIPAGDLFFPKMLTKNLHSDLNPETFYFRLGVTDNEQLEVVQIPPCPPQFDSFHLNVRDNTLDLPRYSSRDITVTNRLMGVGYIAQVVIGSGRDVCCKISTPQSLKAVQREYECLLQITLSPAAASITAPKLLGLVIDDEGVVLGILEEFIANQGSLSDVVKNEAGVFVEERRRVKWIKQIREAVALLHEIGVVWGDGKAENVLVGSASDDCFLVDFGGSYTDGWVDSALMETTSGDDQAVEKIAKFLQDGVRPALM